MPRTVVRKTLSLFGLGGPTNDFEQFGSTAASSPNFTKDIATIQSLSAWTNGWRPALVTAKAPVMQDMNGVMYVHSYETVYLFQEGVAEWDAGTTYFTGSVVKNLANSGYVEFYTSLIDSNLNQALPTRTTNGNWQFNYAVKTGSGLIIPGTPTNDNAPTGNVGEYIESVVASVSAATTTLFGNITSIALTAGDWDLTGIAELSQNSATIPDGVWNLAVSAFSGNTVTDHVTGSNVLSTGFQAAVGNIVGTSIPNWRVSISGSATYYLKGSVGYSAGTPKFFGRLSARRMR
jgi:hypothetical protein